MTPAAAVSVPGKAILLGEHAAVYGHPALVTAVDLRLTARARRAAAPGVAVAGAAEFATGHLAPSEVLDLCRSERPPADRLAYLACGEALLHARALGETGIELTIDSVIPPGSGLGSSAALAVGVVAAVLAAAGASAGPETIGRIAREVERRQHGRPSGVDVEAVLRGGTLWCRRAGEALECIALAVEPGRLAGLELYHTGTPSESTGEMVAAVGRRLTDEPARTRGAFDAIDAATSEARGILTNGTTAGTLRRLVPPFVRTEAALEELGVVPPPVISAIRAIEAAGGAAKVSGAGALSGGAGLVLVLRTSDGIPVPPAWRRLTASLGAVGLREEVAA